MERLRAVGDKTREDKARAQQVESLRKAGGGGEDTNLQATPKRKAKAKADAKPTAKAKAAAKREPSPAAPATTATPDIAAVGVSGLFLYRRRLQSSWVLLRVQQGQMYTGQLSLGPSIWEERQGLSCAFSHTWLKQGRWSW